MPITRSRIRIGGRRLLRALSVCTTGLSLYLAASPAAHAVPSFARQTGQECAACHVGGYGPQLTPYGIKFKLGGYTDSNGKDNVLPLSGMLAGGFTHTQSKQDEAPSAHTNRNNNLTLDEASMFVAGKLADNVGSFMQITYDGIAQSTALDQADLRFAHSFDLAGKDTIFGISVNNNPGVQDPFNTLPVWAYPYTSAATGFSGGDAATMLNGGLEMRVLGASAYAFWDNHLYGEIGTYRALSKRMQSVLGEGAGDDMGHVGGGTAYWRLAWMEDRHKQNFSAGIFGFRTALQPDRLSGGPTNKYDDLGVDASYQFLGTREHIATVNTSYIHERQTRNALFADGGADSRKGKLNEFRLNASYYYRQTYGFTVGRFDTRGQRDASLYADGYANGSPNTSGYILQADWTPWGKEGSWGSPWANLRLGAQYTMFDKFNGASHNYDGSGRDAKDNNTLFLFAWTSF